MLGKTVFLTYISVFALPASSWKQENRLTYFTGKIHRNTLGAEKKAKGGAEHQKLRIYTGSRNWVSLPPPSPFEARIEREILHIKNDDDPLFPLFLYERWWARSPCCYCNTPPYFHHFWPLSSIFHLFPLLLILNGSTPRPSFVHSTAGIPPSPWKYLHPTQPPSSSLQKEARGDEEDEAPFFSIPWGGQQQIGKKKGGG